MTKHAEELDTATAVLAAARTDRAIADAAEARLLQHAVAWAAMHSTDSIDDAATVSDRYGDTGMPVAGEGAPLVAEFAITEFAAAIGVSTDSGARYVGHALELCHRLPRVWRRVVTGDLRSYLARRVADQTLLLSPEAAAFVDRHVSHVAHKIGPVQLERLVDEAIATHMPDLAEERRLAKAESRYFTVEAQQVSYDGTSAVHGELDLADALDLEQAVAGLAAQLKDLGSEDSLDVRRAAAVGELARNAADPRPDRHRHRTSVVEEGAPRPSRNHHRSRRQVVLYVHLSRAAVDGIGTARLENGNQLITAGQVRDWCHTAGTVVVKPVIDLEAHDPVDYRRRPRPARRSQTTVRDRTCVFPWCTRPARRCDTDHTVPHSRGGPTCPCNLAPLCRRHHRIKTHGDWTYTTLEPGHYLWTCQTRLPVPPRPRRHPRRQPRPTWFRDRRCAPSSTTEPSPE